MSDRKCIDCSGEEGYDGTSGERRMGAVGLAVTCRNWDLFYKQPAGMDSVQRPVVVSDTTSGIGRLLFVFVYTDKQKCR